MKQTAVEWLYNNLLKNPVSNDDIEYNNAVLENAKEMEKEQLIDCGNACALFQHIHEKEVNMMSLEELEKYAEEDVINCGEQYYNETFKKQLT
jgi:predicted neutral ceramidase superfamily lipid hydrolase